MDNINYTLPYEYMNQSVTFTYDIVVVNDYFYGVVVGDRSTIYEWVKISTKEPIQLSLIDPSLTGEFVITNVSSDISGRLSVAWIRGKISS